MKPSGSSGRTRSELIVQLAPTSSAPFDAGDHIVRQAVEVIDEAVSRAMYAYSMPCPKGLMRHE
jgi:hypothetical protein